MEFCIGTRDEMWTAEGDFTNVVSKIGREKDLRLSKQHQEPHPHRDPDMHSLK